MAKASIGSNDPLFGAMVSQVNPHRRDEMSRLAELASGSAEKPWDATKYKQELTKFGMRCYVLEHRNGEYIGYVIVARDPLKASLVDIVVHKDHRRRGVGTLLLKYLDSVALTETRRYLEVVVPERNAGMLAFLKHNKIRARKVLRGETTDDFLFRTEIGFSGIC